MIESAGIELGLYIHSGQYSCVQYTLTPACLCAGASVRECSVCEWRSVSVSCVPPAYACVFALICACFLSVFVFDQQQVPAWNKSSYSSSSSSRERRMRRKIKRRNTTAPYLAHPGLSIVSSNTYNINPELLFARLLTAFVFDQP